MLSEKQKELDYKKLTGQLEDQSITKENIPPELIENFLSEFPEYNYIFEGASGGRAGYMGGGIAAIRKPGAIAPTGGPQSGGLPSLYNNVRNFMSHSAPTDDLFFLLMLTFYFANKIFIEII